MKPGTTFFQILTRPAVINPSSPDAMQCVAMTETLREAFEATRVLPVWAIVSCVVLESNVLPLDPAPQTSIIKPGA